MTRRTSGLLPLVLLATAACERQAERAVEPRNVPAEGASAAPAEVGGQAAALSDFAGDWSGMLDVGAQTLPLVLHVDPGATPPVTLDSPNQGAFGLPAAEAATEAVDDGALRVSWPEIGARYTGRLSDAGDRIEGEFAQGPGRLPLAFSRATEADLAPPDRPQEPTGPLPYREEAVHVPVPGTDVSLAGTLTLPEGDGPFPGVVLISGSGPQDRNEEVLTHRPFLVLSDRLTRAGLAVLRYDDRGVGESTGTFEGATSYDFAADAAAALAFLAGRGEVGAVGFVGHSEGGVVAPLAVTEEDAEAAFIVALAGPFVPFAEVLERQTGDALRLSGTAEAEVEEQLTTLRAVLAAAGRGPDDETACAAVDAVVAGREAAYREGARRFCGAWARTLLTIDIPAAYRAADVPTLALFGARDVQVAAETNAEAARGLPNMEVRIVEGANHLFQTAETGAVAEYAEIEETMREDVMTMIARWVEGQAALD